MLRPSIGDYSGTKPRPSAYVIDPNTGRAAGADLPDERRLFRWAGLLQSDGCGEVGALDILLRRPVSVSVLDLSLSKRRPHCLASAGLQLRADMLKSLQHSQHYWVGELRHQQPDIRADYRPQHGRADCSARRRARFWRPTASRSRLLTLLTSGFSVRVQRSSRSWLKPDTTHAGCNHYFDPTGRDPHVRVRGGPGTVNGEPGTSNGT